MSKFVMAVVVLLLMVGVVYGANTITKKAGDYTVQVATDKNPPITGKNNVDVTITDKSGKAVTDAKVVVEYSMPAMAGMPAASYKTNAELKSDIYKAVIEPSMAGGWNMAVKISRGGKTETAKYTLDVK
jgi:outer membrane translocation and assembly module TamA